jgi:putative CocE/NonD family hydrolase
VIAWIAEQDWCDGNVGMFGKSWGAYNAFQVAATRPPALKAIAPVMGTDDRWREDIHFYGGCLANDNFWWGSIMQLYNAMPPDPAIVGDRWTEMWRDRLDGARFWPAMWLEHQTHDEMWRRGSICEDYATSRCRCSSSAAGRTCSATRRSASPNISRVPSRS